MPKSHGHANPQTPTYRSWYSMLKRCTMPADDAYHKYGAKGIKICERWLKFENFLADMGIRPEGKTLDRYPDKKGNYEPGNVRWATQLEQQANRSDNLILIHKGISLIASEWSRQLDLPKWVITSRKARGWSDEETLVTPYIRRGK